MHTLIMWERWNREIRCKKKHGKWPKHILHEVKKYTYIPLLEKFPLKPLLRPKQNLFRYGIVGFPAAGREEWVVVSRIQLPQIKKPTD